MDFSDEHYVRVYTRDTKTWKRLGFEGQTVLMFTLRRLDKAGVLDDIDDLVEDVALVIDVPPNIVRVGLPRLLESGVFEHRGRCLVMPRYIEAQTAKKSFRAGVNRRPGAWSRRHYGAVFARDGQICRYCGRPGKTIDHVLPRSQGGDDKPENLVVACRRCNCRKGARTPAQARMVLQ